MLVSREQLEYVLGAVVDATGDQFDLREAIARAVAQADERPDNHDILKEIRQTRIQRNHAIAEFNEITAGLYKGSCVYTSEAERILGDRMGAAKSKLLGLANRCARVLLKQKREDALKVLSDAVSEIVGEIRPFRVSDFRAKDVKESPSVEEEERGES